MLVTRARTAGAFSCSYGLQRINRKLSAREAGQACKASRWKHRSASGLKVLHNPQLSPTHTHSTITAWHVSPGDETESYQLVLELRAANLTEEAVAAADSGSDVDMEIEIMEDATISSIFHPVGATVAVDEPLAVFCEDDGEEELAAARALTAADGVGIDGAQWQAYRKTSGGPSCG